MRAFKALDLQESISGLRALSAILAWLGLLPSASACFAMEQSTLTDRFQTTIPLEIRRALKLKARQRLSYELRPDGSAILRPVARLDELFASIKLRKPVAIHKEKQAARRAIAREASREGRP